MRASDIRYYLGLPASEDILESSTSSEQQRLHGSLEASHQRQRKPSCFRSHIGKQTTQSYKGPLQRQHRGCEHLRLPRTPSTSEDIVESRDYMDLQGVPKPATLNHQGAPICSSNPLQEPIGSPSLSLRRYNV